MVTNNVTVYQFEVGLDEVFADEVRFHVNVDSESNRRMSFTSLKLVSLLTPDYHLTVTT